MNGSTLRQLAKRVQSKLLFIPATFHLLVAMRRRRPTELWIGDSHAMSTNHDIVSSMFMRGSDGQLILRCGAKLLYTVARDGWPPRVTRVVRLVGLFVRPGSLIPIFSAGEIDIRAHMSKRPDDPLDYVPAYVEQCETIVRQLKAKRSAYLLPPPPCTRKEEDVWFPIVGTLDQLVDNAERLHTRLASALVAVPHAEILDFNDILRDPATGGIRPEYTDDGAHANALAVTHIRAAIRQRDLGRPLPAERTA